MSLIGVIIVNTSVVSVGVIGPVGSQPGGYGNGVSSGILSELLFPVRRLNIEGLVGCKSALL